MGERVIYQIDASCGCVLGNGRGNNEDNFYFNNKHLPLHNFGLKNPISFSGDTTEPVVLAVFDGMGGEARGEEAAFCASEIFAAECKKLDELILSGKQFLMSACDRASNAVCALARENHVGTMGTTVASLFLFQDEVVACNIGDSRAYRVRGETMIQISEDHTDEKILKSMGIAKKPVLLQYIGMDDQNMMIEPTVLKGEIKPGDVYLLCSDGVTDFMDPQQLYGVIQSFDTAECMVDQILRHVQLCGGQDNATVIVVRIN